MVLCNALERYRVEVFSQESCDALNAAGVEGKHELIKRLEDHKPDFGQWLKHSFSGNDESQILILIDALASLKAKHITRFDWPDSRKITSRSVCDQHGAFTEFGWIIVQYLYSAEVPTEVDPS